VRRILSILLIVMMLIGALTIPVGAVESATENINKTLNTSKGGYDSYLSEKPEVSYFEDVKVAELAGGFPKLLEAENTMDMTVSVEADGWYEFYIKYSSVASGEFALKLSIDGKSPFAEAEKLSFPSYWINSGKTRYDNNGNQVAPEQVLYSEETKVAARDYIGVEENPYRFYLTAGNHKISLYLLYGKVEVKGAEFVSVSSVSDYKEYISNKKSTQGKADTIVVQGEDATLKNNRSLIPLSDTQVDDTATTLKAAFAAFMLSSDGVL